MEFTNESQETLIDTLNPLKKKLDKLIEEIKEIPVNARSLDYSPAVLEIIHIESELRFVKYAIKEFQSVAELTEYSEDP